jgi:hypothetical protein
MWSNATSGMKSTYKPVLSSMKYIKAFMIETPPVALDSFSLQVVPGQSQLLLDACTLRLE